MYQVCACIYQLYIQLNGSVEQVARQIEAGRSYAAVISTTNLCTSDADCATSNANAPNGLNAPNGPAFPIQLPGLKYLTLGTKISDAQQAGRAGFTCRQHVCSQSRRFRFRPHVPAHAYMLRVEAVPPVGGGPHFTCFPRTKVSLYLLS